MFQYSFFSIVWVQIQCHDPNDVKVKSVFEHLEDSNQWYFLFVLDHKNLGIRTQEPITHTRTYIYIYIYNTKMGRGSDLIHYQNLNCGSQHLSLQKSYEMKGVRLSTHLFSSLKTCDKRKYICFKISILFLHLFLNLHGNNRLC